MSVNDKSYVNLTTGLPIDSAIDPQARSVAVQLDTTKPATDLAAVREGFRQVARELGNPKEPIYDVQEITLLGPVGDFNARLYRPSADELLPILIYFHGGGFIKGDLETHDAALRAISNRSNWLILAVDYHRTPEYAYPVQIDEAYAALEWVATNASQIGADGNRIAVGGDSVGGCLAAVTAQRARDQHGPKLIYQLLLYPVTDLMFESETQQAFAQGPVLYKQPHLEVLNYYLSRDVDLKQPYASPLFATDFSGLPPALIVTGEFDALRDDGEQYALKLRQSGVVVTGVRYTGMVHDFLLFGGVIDASKLLIEQVAATLTHISK
jgi:acetyl esterase